MDETNLTADAQIASAKSAIGKLYSSINPDGENDWDRLEFALLALAESNLAIARAIQERV